MRGRHRPATVLAVCHGNICRSPFAAALLGRELAGFGIAVQSAGFLGFNRPPPAEAMAVEMRTVRDPVNESRAVFDEVYERIQRCVRQLAGVLGSARG
ncbi:MAG: hypothetical protein DMD59_14365 [Gemmatimonadetes bacterium]|nr:MAG: hypothetical protein DMD59_14365 [Gemmatimonadota bacterium]